MRIFAWLSFAVVAGVLATWLAHGRALTTITERLVIEKVVDPDFGDTTEKTRWEKELRIGLLDVALPTAALFVTVGAILFYRARRG